MRSRLSSSLRSRRGFTLVELLTVIAIVAILATLLSSALSSAKRKANQTTSIGNLRQIALAVNMYLDDHSERPLAFRPMVDARYLSERSLICPEDKSGDWARRIAPTPGYLPGRAGGSELWEDLPRSYFESFSGPDFLWEQVQSSPSGGFAACQLHGIRGAGPMAASVFDYQGLLLRALKDGAVVQRQFFWDTTFEEKGTPAPATDGLELSPFPFFLDPVVSP